MNPVDRILWDAEVSGWTYDRAAFPALTVVVAVDVAVFSAFAAGDVPSDKDCDWAVALLLPLPVEVVAAYFRWIVEESDRTFSVMLRRIRGA